MPGETPGLGELLAEAVAFARGSIATAIPATVVAYDPARQAVTVKPTVSGRYQDPETGALVPFPLPTISNVPVAFPSSAGFAITWPLAPGDTVYLVVADSSLDEWKAGGAPENVPQDVRRFDLTDAIALPGLRPFSRPIPATGWSPEALVLQGVDIRLGSSVAVDFVALAGLVAAELAKLVTTFNAHTHVSAAPGSPTAAPVPLAESPGNVASAKVRSE
jgi:hypothetical protein